MADAKTKGVNGSIANGTTNGGSHNGGHSMDKSGKHSKLWQLVTLAKELSKDAESIRDFDTSVSERKALDVELEAKRGEVKTLREFNDKVVREFSEYRATSSARTDTLFAEFEQKYKTYESNKKAVTAMEAEVVELRAKVQATEDADKTGKEELEKLRQLAHSADAHAQSHAAEIKEMNAECTLHRSQMQNGIAELDACKAKLTEARDHLGDTILQDYSPERLRNLGLELRALSRKCHNLVMEWFSDPDGAKDSVSEIEDLRSRFSKVPLSTSTTRAATQLRCAVAEAIIAEVLQTQVFVPFYLPNGAKAAASSLLELFGDDEKRRSIYRCQILSAIGNPEEVARVEEDIVRKASNEVRTTLLPLVVVFKQAGFYNALPAFFREALRLWSDVQRSRELITAEAPDLNEVQPPGKYDEFDQVSAATTPSHGKSSNKGGAAGKPSIAAVLFPQVASRDDLIFNGMALWSNQSAVIVATQEALPPQVPVNGDNGRHGAHGRRKSVVASDLPLRARPSLNGE